MSRTWEQEREAWLLDAENDYAEMDAQQATEPCGFCAGRGVVQGPKHDAYGYRPDYPDLETCEYCGGTGAVEDGNKLLRAGLRATPDCYGDESRRLFGE